MSLGAISMKIEGKRLRLRDIQLDDLDLYHYWNQPGQHWQELDGPYYPKMTVDELDSMMETIKGRVEASQWPAVRTRLVIAERKTDKLIGTVSRYWISQETLWAAVGIVLYDPAQWGQGLGYEALGLWIDYLFEQEPEWVRLDMRTWSGNLGMIRLAAKLGFVEEARFRKARIVNGEYYDGLGFGILRDEWNARYPDGFLASLE